ncbi:sensor histidine kinase [Archangium primigenium]|uniref:sensor histidine kinase n=1 Tax=[Archangium] primigenium TaxID=2792470 RepID=UPI00195762D5|nr:ATP-binding protein [Archangium primigenium]MBM7116242.1 histidine kinase [Archangium primigenium]
MLSFGKTDLLRMQRTNYFIGAGGLVLGLVLHCAVLGAWSVNLILLQSAWVLIFVLMGIGLGADRLSLKWTGTAAAALAFLGLTGFILLSGGANSPYFHILIALPFLQAVYSPDSRLPAVVGGVSSLLAILLFNAWGGVPLPKQILTVTSFCIFLGLALYGTRMYRHILHSHVAAHQERLRALERLAESERLRGEAERARAEVERLVLVGQLAAGVAHEVNNPLAYVKANLSYLQRETRGGGGTLGREELQEMLDETQQGVLRIQQIVEDLRGFSRAGTSPEERGGLPEALSEATRLAAMRLHGGEVVLELPSGLPMVRLGQRHMVQVLLNLLINAGDAVESARPVRRPRIQVRVRREEGGVRVQVEDNGPGIPEAVLPHLFEPFFTTKPPGKGTGLGLALCREYVARVGGTLQAENHPGGARFVLLLPEAPGLPVPVRMPRDEPWLTR